MCNNMAHPFQDKLIIFIGTPQRCTRREVRDLLETAGGIPYDRVVTFASYVAAFSGAEKTKMYQTALEREEEGFLTIFDEDQFFAILEGRAEPPEKPEHSESVTVIQARDTEAYDREYREIRNNVLNHIRRQNLEKYGVLTPHGRVKLDLCLLEAASYYAKSKSTKTETEDK